MALVAKRRLVHRFENLTHGLLHHAIDHVRDSQTALAASCLGNPHTPDISGAIGPVKQARGQSRQHDVEALAHRVDRLSVRPWGTPIGCYFLEGAAQVGRNRLHRHRLALLSLVPRLRRRARRSPGHAPSRSADGGFGYCRRPFCCPEGQTELPYLLLDRDRLPSPSAEGWDRLSAAFRYYAII